MKKEYGMPLVLLITGMVITIIGALFKLMHWPSANIMLTIGMLTEAAALIFLIINIIKNLK